MNINIKWENAVIASKQIEVQSWGCIYATQQHLCLCGNSTHVEQALLTLAF